MPCMGMYICSLCLYVYICLYVCTDSEQEKKCLGMPSTDNKVWFNLLLTWVFLLQGLHIHLAPPRQCCFWEESLCPQDFNLHLVELPHLSEDIEAKMLYFRVLLKGVTCWLLCYYAAILMVTTLQLSSLFQNYALLPSHHHKYPHPSANIIILIVTPLTFSSTQSITSSLKHCLQVLPKANLLYYIK